MLQLNSFKLFDLYYILLSLDLTGKKTSLVHILINTTISGGPSMIGNSFFIEQNWLFFLNFVTKQSYTVTYSNCITVACKHGINSSINGVYKQQMNNLELLFGFEGLNLFHPELSPNLFSKNPYSCFLEISYNLSSLKCIC